MPFAVSGHSESLAEALGLKRSTVQWALDRGVLCITITLAPGEPVDRLLKQLADNDEEAHAALRTLYVKTHGD